MPRQYRKYDLSDYEITVNGEVVNRHNGRIVKPQLNGKGYLRVGIGGKLYFVHRLVAEKYLPNPTGKPQVNHKDGNKLNNSVNNLEWVTNQENRTHAVINGLHPHGECSYAKLTQKAVSFIREHTEYSAKELSELFNVSVSTIRDARKFKSWKD